MKVGDLVKMKYPRKPQHGGTGVIVENDNTFVSLPNSPNWFRVIWTDSQTVAHWRILAQRAADRGAK